MKYFSFKIFILCVLLPPVLYALSLGLIERSLIERFDTGLQDAYIGDSTSILSGTVVLKDAIAENVDRYLESKSVLDWGVEVSVTVSTKGGRLLYPDTFETEKKDLLPEDPMKIAADNFTIMNQGLNLKVDLKVGHNTLLANTLLAAYIMVAILFLYHHYRTGSKKAKADAAEKSREIARLSGLEQNHVEKLALLDHEKQDLSTELVSLKKKLEHEKNRASQNEEELIEDIVNLEDKIEANIALQDKQQQEIEALKGKISSYEKGKKKTKSRRAMQKRFKTLYKKLSVNDRAVDGYMDLTEEMKIKCEEIIHQINEDPKMVTIKRKVFGKKNRETVLEVIFAYKGRLYFRSTAGKKIEILAVGTKNTQSRELEFLDGL